MNVCEQIEGFEGREKEAYPDPLTKHDPIKKGKPWTIGVGHTGPEVHEGLVWTDEQITAVRDHDIAKAQDACFAHFPFFKQLNEPRQAVLINMVFQMGVDGVLKFQQSLAAIRDGHYEHAKNLMLQSKWAKQTPNRAKRLADQMATGAWQ